MSLSKKIETSIYIKAPTNFVWAVTIDIEQWPTWTPTVNSVRKLESGPLKPGSKASLKQPGQPKTVWIVTEYVPEALFSWKTRFPGLEMIASHELKSKGAGTVNTLRVELSGILSLALWPLLKVAILKALTEENQGLKTRCETSISEALA